MANNLPVILIKANEEIQNIVRNPPLTSLKADCIFTKSARETENLLNSSIIDLLIYQIEDTGKKNLNVNLLLLKLTKKNPVPVIFLFSNRNQKLQGLDKIEPGSFDLIVEPIEKHLLLNKISALLKSIELRKELADLKSKRPPLSKQLNNKTRFKQNRKVLNSVIGHEIHEGIIETIPGPIALKNSKGKYITCNKAFEDLIGTSKDELIGNSVFDNAYPEFATRIRKSDIDAIKSNKIISYETKYHKKDGSTLDLMIYKNRINLAPNNEPGTITLVTDITHTKRAEDLLNIQYTIDYLASLNKGLKKTLYNILKHIFRLYWVDAGGIYIFDSISKKINLTCHTGLSKRFVKEVKSYDIDSNQMELLLKKESVYTKSSDLPLAAKTLNEKEGILSVAVIPLINGETSEFVGNLNLASKKYEEISEEDKKGVESIARRIVNLILYAQSQEKLKEARLLLEHKVEEKTKELNIKIKELTIKENEIRKSEHKYRKLQENLPVGIFSTSPDGKLLYANPATAKIFGYDSTEDVTKVHVPDLYYSKEQRNEFLQALVAEGKLINKEVQLVRKDKTVFWGMLRVQAAFDKQGIPFLFDGVIEDISEIKNAKLLLEEANKKITSINKNLEKKIQEALGKHETQNALLIQKSKLESLGELSAGIAHEINQPLGVMALTFENLKLKINAEKLTPEYLDTKFQSIEENIRRIREIIDHIRTFSRDQESFVLNKVNVNKVVRKALSMIGAQYSNHNINIRLDLKEDIGFTVGSNLKLEQVILNLLANSKYALEEKGTFEGETEFSKEILIKTDTTPDKIILLVEDNGAGIKAKHLTRIFDPFFTTKPEGFGTGLGLSIVYGLVKDMRGEIVVDSKERKYTKFRITFPRFPEKD